MLQCNTRRSSADPSPDLRDPADGARQALPWRPGGYLPDSDVSGVRPHGGDLMFPGFRFGDEALMQAIHELPEQTRCVEQ
jgi:hypothetical protein